MVSLSWELVTAVYHFQLFMPEGKQTKKSPSKFPGNLITEPGQVAKEDLYSYQSRQGTWGHKVTKNKDNKPLP